MFDKRNIDWAPSLQLGHEKQTVNPDIAMERYNRVNKRRKRLLEDEEVSSQFHSTLESENNEEESNPVTRDVMCQTDLTLAEMEHLEKINSESMKELAKLKFTIASFEKDDNRVKFYTGLPNFVTLAALFDLIKPYISTTHLSALTKFQQFMVLFLRLRLNLTCEDISYRFNVSQSTVSRIFLNILDLTFARVSFLVRWPEREELYKTMPMSFRQHFGTKVTVIVDCFEVFIERPLNLLARAQTFSSYKHHNTIKFLIGIAPQGAITFISKAWGGRTSDKWITEQCGILKNLLPGDVILADRGFNIEENAALYCAEVKIPSFTRGKKQLEAFDVESTRKIASVRIHVERVIGLVRRKYKILQSTLPTDYLSNKDSDGLTSIDKITIVACSLTNICSSVVPLG